MDTSSSIFSLMTLPEMSMRLFFRSSRFPLLATLDLWKFTCHTNNSLPELSSPARIDLEGRLCWCWQPGMYAKDWQVHGELVLMSKESSSINFFIKRFLLILLISSGVFCPGWGPVPVRQVLRVRNWRQVDAETLRGVTNSSNVLFCTGIRSFFTGRPCVRYSWQVLQPPSKVRKSFWSISLAIWIWYFVASFDSKDWN